MPESNSAEAAIGSSSHINTSNIEGSSSTGEFAPPERPASSEFDGGSGGGKSDSSRCSSIVPSHAALAAKATNPPAHIQPKCVRVKIGSNNTGNDNSASSEPTFDSEYSR